MSPKRAELEFASRHFSSIELNGTFYSLQRPEYFADWYTQTPPGFVFALKGGRFITHMKKLRNIESALANFFASGVLALEDKLGPLLWQFPESMPAELDRFAEFFALLPRDTRAASRLAARHDARLIGRSLTRSRKRRPLRHAVEVRNRALVTPEFMQLLRRSDVGWVIADTAGRWPLAEDVTSDFVYIRLHGDKALYQSGYSNGALARWAERISLWSAGAEPPDARLVAKSVRPSKKPRDVYVYFDNDIKVHAPFDALALLRATGVGTFQPDAPLAARRKPGKLHVNELPRSGGFIRNRLTQEAGKMRSAGSTGEGRRRATARRSG